MLSLHPNWSCGSFQRLLVTSVADEIVHDCQDHAHQCQDDEEGVRVRDMLFVAANLSQVNFSHMQARV